MDADESIQHAIEIQDWETVRLQILTKHLRSREQVGLGAESDLSVVQLAALYEPDVVGAMRDSGLTLDLHSVAAPGDDAIIAQFDDEFSFAEEAEYLTPMGFALIKSNTLSVTALLKAGDNVNRSMLRIGFFVWEIAVLNIGSWLPVHLTCTHDYFENGPEMLELLIAHGADRSSFSPLGAQPIHHTAIYGWLELTKVLLRHGVPVDSRTGGMHDKVWTCSAPKTAMRSSNMTPLMIAAQEGNASMVDFLHSHGADVNARDSLGNSALHHAADGWWSENVEMVKLLLDAGSSRSDQCNELNSNLVCRIEGLPKRCVDSFVSGKCH